MKRTIKAITTGKDMSPEIRNLITGSEDFNFVNGLSKVFEFYSSHNVTIILEDKETKMTDTFTTTN